MPPRVYFGRFQKTWQQRLVHWGLYVGGSATAVHIWYNRNCLMEGGATIRQEKFWLTQDSRLADWYFDLIGQKTAFVHTFQYQMVLSPTSQLLPADDLLTEVCRHLLGSWAFTPERVSRGRLEPLDRITVDEVMRSRFRPPAEYDESAAAPPDPAAAAKPAPALTGAAARLVESAGEDLSPEAREAVATVLAQEAAGQLGDVVNGYFVYRRFGEVRPDMIRKAGGATAQQVGARSIVLAPDPWEGTCWVVSVTPYKFHCIVRLLEGISHQSPYLPAEGALGIPRRLLYRWRCKWLLSAACWGLEADWDKGEPAHYRAPPHVPKSVQSAAAALGTAGAA